MYFFLMVLCTEFLIEKYELCQNGLVTSHRMETYYSKIQYERGTQKAAYILKLPGVFAWKTLYGLYYVIS